MQNSRLFQAMVVEKIAHESVRKVSYELASEFAASFQNSKVGSSSGQHQLLGLILAKKWQYFSEPCQAAPVTIQNFLEMRCSLTKCLEKTSSYFCTTLSMTTVWHSPL